MKFVKEFLQSHHLRQNPHKWIFAVLLSPIHTAEMHYKKHYHMQFVHARKIFLFDMTLLMTLVLVFISGIFWWTYDPTVTDLVYLSITPSHERLISGQEITYTIHYENESDVTLTHPTISIDTPPGLSIDNHDPHELLYDTASQTFTMSPIGSHTSGTISFSGTFFATPHVENTIHTTLSYIQQNKEKREQKTSPAIIIVRDSIIDLDIDIPPISLGDSSIPLTLTLTNTGDIPVSDITLPLIPPRYTDITTRRTTDGTIENNIWTIPTLDQNQTAKLETTLTLSTPNNISSIPLSFTPAIMTDDTTIDQKTIDTSIDIIHPHITISSAWEQPQAQPGTIQNITLDLKNTTNISLSDITILVPSTPHSTKQTQQIKTLASQQTQSITLPITIINNGITADTDPILILTPQITAHIPQIPQTSYNVSHTTPAIPIGTSVFLNAELRYYTAEGDQLGRGPIPPQIGTETKYWAFIRVSNTTSRIKNLYLTATLPSYVSWTGKTSVSHGQDVQYNESTKQLTWSHASLDPHTTAGIYIELALTPTTDMYATSPIMLQNISLSTHDTYIDIPISRTARSIDISLPSDPIGNSKGILVQ